MKIALERSIRVSAASFDGQASSEPVHGKQELERSKRLIEAQRLENFSLMIELMNLKAELATLKTTSWLAQMHAATQESKKAKVAKSQHLTSPPRQFEEISHQSFEEWSGWEDHVPSWLDDEDIAKRKQEVKRQYHQFDKELYVLHKGIGTLQETKVAKVEWPWYVIKCKLREQIRSYMKKFKRKEDIRGYHPVDPSNWRTEVVLKDQP